MTIAWLLTRSSLLQAAATRRRPSKPTSPGWLFDPATLFFFPFFRVSGVYGVDFVLLLGIWDGPWMSHFWSAVVDSRDAIMRYHYSRRRLTLGQAKLNVAEHSSPCNHRKVALILTPQPDFLAITCWFPSFLVHFVL